jgi:6-phosphogluconolactonase
MLSISREIPAEAGAVEVYSDGDTLIRAEAERIVKLAAEAVAARGRFSLALSGGSTPRPLYELLATPAVASRINWFRVDVFWGDERCVPPEDAESNFRMAREALLDHVPIPPENVYRIAGEADPHAAARAYEHALRSYFGVAVGPPDRSFDLVLLGMGEDGHTASLFPGTPPVTEEQHWVMANHLTQPRDTWRITLTPVVLNAAGTVTFLVAGASKAKRLCDVLAGPKGVLPAQRIHPTHGALTWMVDAAAASQLKRPP